MTFSAKILADSVNPAGARLTTFEIVLPRVILAEVLTHRVMSRNTASSRAIPVEKIISQVEKDPFIPVHWGKNQSGMVAEQELVGEALLDAKKEWLAARDSAVKHVRTLQAAGLHKQVSNRLLEPWMWVTQILTATEFSNFFDLRCHKDAQPEFRRIADLMQALYNTHKPIQLAAGSWHIPMIDDKSDLEKSFGLQDILKISAGRCARVSYLTHDGKRDPKADIELAERLLKHGHFSPWEHSAQSMSTNSGFIRNFRGWRQLRSLYDGQSVR